jgi:hypothetical protein
MTVGSNLHTDDKNAGRAAMTPRPPLPLDRPLAVHRETRSRSDRAALAITRRLRLVGHVRNA